MTYLANANSKRVAKYLKKIALRVDPWLSLLIGCFTLLGWLSWGKLAELLWDTGHEVEIPARLLDGQILYRDVDINYGPLPYYIHALALSIFGQRIEVFYVLGLILAFISTLLVYKLAKKLTNVPWAVLCTLYFLIYCAFRPRGLWNFLVPYSYGVVYGTVFCLVGLIVLDRYVTTRKLRWLAISAIAAGLAGLAKQEYGVAAILSLLVGANLDSPKSLRAVIGRSTFIILVVSISLLIPLSLLAQQSSWETVWTALFPTSKSSVLLKSGLFDVSLAKTLSEWKYHFRLFVATSSIVWLSEIATNWIFRHHWQTTRWFQLIVNFFASLLFAWFGIFLLQTNPWKWQDVFQLIGSASLIVWGILAVLNLVFKNRFIPQTSWVQILTKVVASLTLLLVSSYLLRRLSCCSADVFHPVGSMVWLPPALVVWFAIKWSSLIQNRYRALLWALLVFSVLVNARFLFYINFYGLYAVTAVILFFALLYQFARETKLPIGRYLLICLLIGGSVNLAKFNEYRYPVKSSQGLVYSSDANLALAFNQAINVIKSSGAKSVLLIPEGSTLNFLTATHSPSRETIFIPGVLPTAEAEKEFIGRMQNNLPELIVYVDVPFFWLKEGYQSYAQYNPLVHNWISDRYQLIHSSPVMIYHERPWNLRIYARK